MRAVKLYIITPARDTIQKANMDKECLLDRFETKFPGTEYTLVNSHECENMPDEATLYNANRQLWYLGESILGMATADIILVQEDAVDNASCAVELCATKTYGLPQIFESDLGLRFSEFEESYHDVIKLIKEIEEGE